MDAPQRRRFTIADGMVLVVATAVGLMLARAYINSIFEHYPPRFRTAALLARGSGNCLAAACMLVLIPLRLKQPRPPLRRLVRQPGFAACVAAAVALGWAAVDAGCEAALMASHDPASWPFYQIWHSETRHVAAAVVGAWLALWASGLCRPERGWVDRLGRVLGGWWLVWLAVSPILVWVRPWIPRL